MKKHLIALVTLIGCLSLSYGIVRVGLGWPAVLVLGTIYLYMHIYNTLNKK